MNNLRNVNLNLLPILRELLVEENVSRAGERLNLSQSATSEALGRLRLILKDQLLVQEGRKMRLTPYAKQLLPHVEEAVSAVEKVLIDPKFDPATSDRTFSISTADYVTNMIGPLLSHKLAEEAPSASLQFTGIQLSALDQLIAGEIDFAIAPNRALDNPQLLKQELFRERFVIISARSNKKIGKKLTARKFSSMRHAIYQPGIHVTGATGQQLIQSLPNPPHVAVRVNQFSMLGSFVADSDMIAAVQYRLAVRLADEYNLDIHELPLAYPETIFAAYWSYSTHRDPAAAWFLEKIEQACSALD